VYRWVCQGHQPTREAGVQICLLGTGVGVSLLPTVV
jgi:hypothetical protein